MTTTEVNPEVNAETTEQLIRRLETSTRRFVRDEIEETERNLRRNNKGRMLVWAAGVPMVIVQVALAVQALLTADTAFGDWSLGTIGGVVFQTFFPVLVLTAFLVTIHQNYRELQNRLQDLTDKLEAMESKGPT
jgi:hypothetical protein